MSKNKIEYAEIDTLPQTIEDKDVTIQISLKVEGDLLKAIRAKAAEAGMPYQTYMKHAVREFMRAAKVTNIETRVGYLETKLAELLAQGQAMAADGVYQGSLNLGTHMGFTRKPIPKRRRR